MKELLFGIICIIIVSTSARGQGVVIGTQNLPADPSAILDIKSSDKGLLIPRADTSNIASPANGLLVLQPADNQFYVYKSDKWIALGADAVAPVFKRENNVISNTAPLTEVDFLFGASQIPGDSIITDKMLFYDKGKGALRGGQLANSDAWSPDNVGGFSISWGRNNLTKGLRAYTFGQLDTVYGDYGSGAVGAGNFVGGDYGSTAIGHQNRIADNANNGATAIGFSNLLGPNADDGAMALGYQNVNNGGQGSIVMGYDNASIADTGSVTIGRNLINNYKHAIILGRYNAYSYYDVEPIFAIGKGTSDFDINNPRHDALSILNNGNVGINNNFPESMFEVGNSGTKPRQGIKILGDQANKHVHLILANNGVGGQSYSMVSTGDNAVLGNGKFAIRNVDEDIEHFVIDSTGNIGLNEANPGWALDVNVPDDSFAQGINVQGATETSQTMLQLANNHNFGRVYRMISGGGNSTTLRGKFSIKDQTADQHRLVIDSLGDVGLGKLNPKQKLDVNGAIKISDTATDEPGSIKYDGQFWGYSGGSWQKLANETQSQLADNDDDTRIDLEQTTDADNIQFVLDDEAVFRIENAPNAYARLNPQNVKDNIVIGSGKAVVDRDSFNIYIGKNVANSHGDAAYNVYIGQNVAQNLPEGVNNVAIGKEALMNGPSPENVVAIGHKALAQAGGNYVDGSIAIGDRAGETAKLRAIYIGQQAGSVNDGIENIFIGNLAGINKTTGGYNTYIGNSAGYYSGSGYHNTLIGAQSGYNLSTGVRNTLIGHRAGYNVEDSQNHTLVGNEADVESTYFSCTAIGAFALGTATHQARIGNSFTTSIGGYAGWTNVSDGRFKQNVQENVPGLDFITNLRPVTYQLDIDALHQFLDISEEGRDRYEESKNSKESIVQTGFIAQEVEQLASDLGFSFSGVDEPKNERDHYGLRYAEFVVPLVKAVQEQQEQIESLQKENLQLKEQVDALDELRAEIASIKLLLGS